MVKPAGTFILVHGGNISTDTWNKLAKVMIILHAVNWVVKFFMNY
jgi:hypothetical protein